jgi:predicted nucleic acid-binding protein
MMFLAMWIQADSTDLKTNGAAMKIYLDVSCLNRPFDDQNQTRIRLEGAAIGAIFEQFDDGRWSQVSSEMARIEIAANPNRRRRVRVQLLLPDPDKIVILTPAMFDRGAELEKFGIKPADAMHVAAAESAGADVLLTCDDRLCKAGQRHRAQLRVPVRNPLDWLKEIENANDSR